MKVLILGIGVIGTTYGYLFKSAGHQVEHLVRDSTREQLSTQININMLDGRFKRKGNEYSDTYDIAFAEKNSEYDFILVSVSCGKLESAMDSLKAKNVKGTILLFCNFWDTRDRLAQIMDGYPYIIGFPTAGGCINRNTLTCVLFDHIMLEHEEKTSIPNYPELESLLASANIKSEKPFDMAEWIWIHMAINAGVTMTAAEDGNIENPTELAIRLMDDAKALSRVVLSIRETTAIVEARGVDLEKYKNEISLYRIPSKLAGIAMKHLFKTNELTRRIMTLHNDVSDILYGCTCVYETGKALKVKAPIFYKALEAIVHDEKIDTPLNI